MVLLAGAATWTFAKYQSRTHEFNTLQEDNLEMRDRYGNAIGEIAAIQDSLNAIVLGEEEARLVSELDAESRLTESQGDQALARISVIKAGIERTKDRIQDLDRDLKARGVRIAGLEKMIDGLKRSVADKEARVAALATQVDTLQNQVSVLATHVEAQDRTIEEQSENIEAKRREVSTVYYVVGTKRELTESGAVVASGGLLGIGKTLEPTGRVNPALAQSVDTDHQMVIHIPSERVEVITAQPEGSYRLQLVGGETELVIVDPVAFRKVKHLVVMTG
jgi:predicted RNase H-like nuclease (RuvC/YqgF family)